MAFYAIQEKDRNNSGESSYMARRLLSLLIVDYMLHNIVCYIDSLPRYHIVGYSGTMLRLTVRYRAHIPPAGYTLFRELTIREVAAP